jgi:hypothetical protein
MSRGTTLGLSGHQERDQATAEDANGRTGLFVKLTVKQVTIGLTLAATLAGGIATYLTREPKPATEQKALARTNAAEPKVEDIDQRLRSYAETQEAIRADVRDTRDQVRDLRGDIRELRSMVRAVAPRRNAANGQGGGSK